MKPEKGTALGLKFLNWKVLPLVLFLLGATIGIMDRIVDGLEFDILSDDAYYYTIVAKNYVNSGLISFDGIHETNGFHPLLFWLQVILFNFLGENIRPFGVYAALIICSALVFFIFLGIFSYYYRIFYPNEEKRRFCFALLIAFSMCFIYRHFPIFFTGMESTLSFPVFVILALFVYLRKHLQAGLLGALLVSSRLDAFLYLLIPLFFIIVGNEFLTRKNWKSAVRLSLQLFAPAVVFILLFMAYNYYKFGFWMPISGALKSSFPRIHFQPYLLSEYFPILILMMTLAGGGLIVYRKEVQGRLRLMGLVFFLVTLTQLSSFVFFQKWAKSIPPWYQGMPLFTASACLGIGVANIFPLKRLKILTVICLFFLLLINSGILLKSVLFAAGNTEFKVAGRTETIDFIKTKSKEELWAYTDCGEFSFWSERDFVNLDGLINNFEYQEY